MAGRGGQREGGKVDAKSVTTHGADRSPDREDRGRAPAERSLYGDMMMAAYGGVPLAAEDRAWFEDRLRVDLSGVRVHEGAAAAGVTEPLDAAAVTSGSDIYFSPQAAPHGTPEGRRTLGHELAHVAQFERGSGGGASSHATLEHEAASAAAITTAGGAAPVRGQASPSAGPLTRRKDDEKRDRLGADIALLQQMLAMPGMSPGIIFRAVLATHATEQNAADRVTMLKAAASLMDPSEAAQIGQECGDARSALGRRFGRLATASRVALWKIFTTRLDAEPAQAPPAATAPEASTTSMEVVPVSGIGPDEDLATQLERAAKSPGKLKLQLLTSEPSGDYQPPPREDVPTLGIRVLGVRYSHMAAVGATNFWELELPKPMTQAEVVAFLFENGRAPKWATVGPLPEGSKTPTTTWIVGGPSYAFDMMKQGVPMEEARSFDYFLKDEVRATLFDQLGHEDVKRKMPDWYSAGTGDVVKQTHKPPEGADIKLAPSAAANVYVWKEGDVWYWFNVDTGVLSGFHREASAGDWFNNWTVWYIEHGMEPSKAMDQTVRDMEDTNRTMLGAFAMALASATPMHKPPPIPMPRMRGGMGGGRRIPVAEPPMRTPSIEPPEAPIRAPDIEPPSATIRPPEVEPPAATIKPPEVEPPTTTVKPPEVEPPATTVKPPEAEPEPTVVVKPTAKDQGNILGWGKGQTPEDVAQTRALTDSLTPEKVKGMVAQGLSRDWVQQQLNSYRAALAKGQAKLNNTQLLPRKALMEKLLSMWPG